MPGGFSLNVGWYRKKTTNYGATINNAYATICALFVDVACIHTTCIR